MRHDILLAWLSEKYPNNDIISIHSITKDITNKVYFYYSGKGKKYGLPRRDIYQSLSHTFITENIYNKYKQKYRQKQLNEILK